MRTAARPVGATSITRAPRSVALAAMVLIEAVLPVPGPPVMTDSRCSNAASSAACCSAVSSLGASESPRRVPTPLLAQPWARRAAQQRVHARGQLGLELGGGAPVDPLCLTHRVALGHERLDAGFVDLGAEQLAGLG